MDTSKISLPNDFIELKVIKNKFKTRIKKFNFKVFYIFSFLILKSLIADLRSFRLEEFSLIQRDRNKLNHIHAEIQNYYTRQLGGANAIDPTESLNIIVELWDRLENTMQNRETQLEKAIQK